MPVTLDIASLGNATSLEIKWRQVNSTKSHLYDDLKVCSGIMSRNRRDVPSVQRPVNKGERWKRVRTLYTVKKRGFPEKEAREK
ncbi:hypothetical protein AVEN_180017-1 [Araneus ventricosus]|uniref:Uncharacterized protein n=1 Tax=Araneus ventricosus TaxID=182803 RepID=A0A4Y2H115_ARAVE|nr:hypothetical protein AVEN_180017-1 [Araneus ventricosus]